MDILLFGITKSIIGSNHLSIDTETTDKATLNKVADLKAYLELRYPELKNLHSLAIAVNNQYADADTLISAHDEIALIPPVSGG